MSKPLTREQFRSHLDFVVHEPYNPLWADELIEHNELVCDQRDQAQRERDDHRKYIDEIWSHLSCHRAFIPDYIDQLKEQLAASEARCKALEQARDEAGRSPC